MPRFTGNWRLVEEGRVMIWKQVSFPSAGRPQTVELKRLFPNRPLRRDSANWILHYGVHDTSFRTKDEALEFAMDWMRSHPDG